MCVEAPVARAFYEAIKAKLGPRVFFLGIVGDQAHSVRRSGHNCGAMRELDCTDPNFAHAVDIGVMDDAAAQEILRIAFEEQDVHYMIYDGVGYRPRHRGGGRFTSSGHEGHVHISFGCGSTFHTNFDFVDEDDLMGAREDILAAIRNMDDHTPNQGSIERLRDTQLEQGQNLRDVQDDVAAIKADVAAIKAHFAAEDGQVQ